MQSQTTTADDDNRDRHRAANRLSILARRSSLRLGAIIDDTSVALCLAHRTPTGLHIDALDSRPIDVIDPNIWSDVLTQATTHITSFLSDYSAAGIPVNIGLVGSDIAFRRMYLPAMSRREMKQAVLWEGNKLFPFDIAHSCVWYRVVDTIKRDQSRLLGINISAAKNAVIDDLYRVGAAAGLNLGQIQYLPVMMTPASRLSRRGGEPAHRHLLIHLDTKRSMAIFIHGESLEFYQEFITPPLPDENDSSIANLDAITAELQSFLDLYTAQRNRNSIDSILLSGPMPGLTDTAAGLQSATDLPCTVIDTQSPLLKKVSGCSLETMRAHLPCIAVAAAAPKVAALAPRAELTRRAKRTFVRHVATAATLALITVTALHIPGVLRENTLNRRLDTQKQALTALETCPGYHGYASLVSKLSRTRALVQSTGIKNESHFHLLMKALTLNVPDQVNLTVIRLNERDGGYRMRIEGHVKLSGFSPEIVLAQYVESLEALPCFQNIQVTHHGKRQIENMFDLVFNLEMEAQV